MQESQTASEAWVCLDRQINTHGQKDLLCLDATMSHFLEFRPLVGTVASIANAISLMVATQPAGSLKASLLGVCYMPAVLWGFPADTWSHR